MGATYLLEGKRRISKRCRSVTRVPTTFVGHVLLDKLRDGPPGPLHPYRASLCYGLTASSRTHGIRCTHQAAEGPTAR
eukprot:2976796-Pyramimonas_sp.AAC.1